MLLPHSPGCTSGASLSKSGGNILTRIASSVRGAAGSVFDSRGSAVNSRGYSMKKLREQSEELDAKYGVDSDKFDSDIDGALTHASIAGDLNILLCMTDKDFNWITPHSDARCDGGGMDAVNASWSAVYGQPMTDQEVADRKRKYTFNESELVTRDGQTMTHEEYTGIKDKKERHGFLFQTEERSKTALARLNAPMFINHIGADFVPHSTKTLDELGFHILSEVEKKGMDAVTPENQEAYERERRRLDESGLMTMTDMQDTYEALQMTGSYQEAQKSHVKSGFMSTYASEFLGMHLSNKKVVFSSQEDLESYLGVSADEAEFKEHINTEILKSLRHDGWEGMQKWVEASIAAQTARQEEEARRVAALSGGSTTTTPASEETAASAKKRRRSARGHKRLFDVRPIKSKKETHDQRTARKRAQTMDYLQNLMGSQYPDTMSSSRFFSSSGAPSTTALKEPLRRSAMKGGRAAWQQQGSTVSSELETSQSFMSDATGTASETASQYSFPTGAAKRGEAQDHSFPTRTGASSAASALQGWTPARVRAALQKGAQQSATQSAPPTSCASEMNTSAYSSNTLSSMPSMGLV